MNARPKLMSELMNTLWNRESPVKAKMAIDIIIEKRKKYLSLLVLSQSSLKREERT